MRLTYLSKQKQKKKTIFKRVKLLILKLKSIKIIQKTKTIRKFEKIYKYKLIRFFKLVNQNLLILIVYVS